VRLETGPVQFLNGQNIQYSKRRRWKYYSHELPREPKCASHQRIIDRVSADTKRDSQHIIECTAKSMRLRVNGKCSSLPVVMETLNHDGSLMVQDGGISHDGGLVEPNVGQTTVLPPYWM